MDVAGTAVGVASLGIQICQGLLSYYNDWKGFGKETSEAHKCIDDLRQTFVLLHTSLQDAALDHDRFERVKGGLRSCEGGLLELQEELLKIQKHKDPVGMRQKAQAEFQRLAYPFRKSTLTGLVELVDELRGRLSLALQGLQLDLSLNSHVQLTYIANTTDEIAVRTIDIQGVVAQNHAQGEVIQHSLNGGITRITDQVHGIALDNAALQALTLQGHAQVDDFHQSLTTKIDALMQRRQPDDFRKIISWLSPPDPMINHDAARKKHEPYTGSWLLQSDQYQQWKTSRKPHHHLWLHGKAGCGKTVLCSTVVEDIFRYHANSDNVGYAMFYFSFTDSRKQSFRDCLLSLAAQLCWKEPGLSELRRLHERLKSMSPRSSDLESILLSSMQAFDEVVVLLDALDECPDTDYARDELFDGLGRLSQNAPRLRMLATSREISAIHASMDRLRVEKVPIDVSHADADISRYVSSMIAADSKLSKLDDTSKNLIQITFAEKADGMFRWAFCQMERLKQLKSSKASIVKQILSSLPPTLDATYERMLVEVDEVYQHDAVIALQWLAFAERPLAVEELAEATIIDVDGEGNVNEDERGSPEDILDILSTLVIVERVERGTYWWGRSYRANRLLRTCDKHAFFL